MSTPQAPRPLARRATLRLLAAAGAGLAIRGRPGRRALAQEGPDQASLLTWPGYDRAELYTPYIAKHGGPPLLSLFEEIDQAHAKLIAGWHGDLVHPCFERVVQWRRAGYLQAIDTSRLSNWGGVFAPLTGLPGTREAWKSWFIPFDWGQTSIVYRSDVVRWNDGVESWALLWDERFKGRIGVVDMAQDAWWSAALYSGTSGKPLESTAQAEVRAALDALAEQIALVGSPSALERAIAAGDIVAALGWNDSVSRLRRQGVPVAFADPVEGALTWCCGLVMHAKAPSPDKAYDLIDSLIAPETGTRVIETFGFGHANRLSFEQVGDERLAALGLPIRPLASLERALFVEEPEPALTNRIERDWAEVTGRPQPRRRFRGGAAPSGDSQ